MALTDVDLGNGVKVNRGDTASEDGYIHKNGYKIKLGSYDAHTNTYTGSTYELENSGTSTANTNSNGATTYSNALTALKKKKPDKVKSSDINNLFTLGAAIGKGKASVLLDIVSGEPFTWKNIFKAIIDANGITRYNLVKT